MATVVQVTYSRRVGGAAANAVVNTGPADEDEDEEGVAAKPAAVAELWDLTRPLEGDCLLELKTFDDAEGKMVSSLAQCYISVSCEDCWACDMAVAVFV